MPRIEQLARRERASQTRVTDTRAEGRGQFAQAYPIRSVRECVQAALNDMAGRRASLVLALATLFHGSVQAGPPLQHSAGQGAGQDDSRTAQVRSTVACARIDTREYHELKNTAHNSTSTQTGANVQCMAKQPSLSSNATHCQGNTCIHRVDSCV